MLLRQWLATGAPAREHPSLQTSIEKLFSDLQTHPDQLLPNPWILSGLRDAAARSTNDPRSPRVVGLLNVDNVFQCMHVYDLLDEINRLLDEGSQRTIAAIHQFYADARVEVDTIGYCKNLPVFFRHLQDDLQPVISAYTTVQAQATGEPAGDLHPTSAKTEPAVDPVATRIVDLIRIDMANVNTITVIVEELFNIRRLA